jgi:hypothetical protein
MEQRIPALRVCRRVSNLIFLRRHTFLTYLFVFFLF